jgi:hypothetical protein
MQRLAHPRGNDTRQKIQEIQPQISRIRATRRVALQLNRKCWMHRQRTGGHVKVLVLTALLYTTAYHYCVASSHQQLFRGDKRS